MRDKIKELVDGPLATIMEAKPDIASWQDLLKSVEDIRAIMLKAPTRVITAGKKSILWSAGTPVAQKIDKILRQHAIDVEKLAKKVYKEAEEPLEEVELGYGGRRKPFSMKDGKEMEKLGRQAIKRAETGIKKLQKRLDAAKKVYNSGKYGMSVSLLHPLVRDIEATD